MNLMHENLQVTDGVYGIFSSVAVQYKIRILGNSTNDEVNQKEVLKIIEVLLANPNTTKR